MSLGSSCFHLLSLALFWSFTSALFGLGTAQNEGPTTDPVEVAALNSIFEQWNISSSMATITWNTTGDPCSGNATLPTSQNLNFRDDDVKFNPAILCSCDSNNTCHIMRLKATNLQIVGTIPDELRELKYLNNLQIAKNYLTGPLPAFFGSFSDMLYLSVGLNSLSGPLPKELGNLSKLISLGLGSRNNFSGSIPPELGNLTSLEQMYVDSNGLEGEIPDTLVNLQKLKTLWASDNNFEPSSSTTAETPVTSDAPSESYPNPTSPSPTIVLHPRREAFEHGLLPIPKLIYTDGTLTLASIKQKLLSAAAKSSQITSTVLAEVVDIPIDQAALVIDTLVSVLPPLSPRPSDEEEDEGVADVFDLMLFLYIQSYKRLLTRTHKDSATVTDVWPSTSVFDGVLSTLSPLQLVRSNTRRLMPSQVDEEAHQLSYLNKHISNMLNLLAESVEGEGDESLVLSLERFEHLGFLIHFCENGSKRVLLSQISPFFANSDPDMPAAPVSITQIHEWLQQNINASLDHITEKISAKDNITQPVLDVDITMADACNSNMKGSIGCDPMDSRNLTFVEGISKASVCKHGGDIKGNTVKVSHCHDSVIYILAPLRYATVYGCSDATIVLGAIGKAVRIEHCERVHIIAACKRICIANCRECIFYLGVNQRPLILGDNHKLQVAPYNTFYTQLNEHMNEVNVQATINKWNEPLILGMIDPHDSLSHPAGVSDIQAESATCLDPELFTNFLIPNLLKAESKQPTKENPFSLPGEYSASLRKKHVAVVNIQQAIKESQLDENKRRELSTAIHAHFKEWLYATGNIKQLYFLQAD